MQASFMGKFLLHFPKVHTFVLKKLSNVSPRAPSDMAYGGTARFPLYVHSYTACIEYCLRLTTMDVSRLPREACNMLLLLHNAGQCCWVSQAHQVLYKFSFGFVWEDQGVQNLETFVKASEEQAGFRAGYSTAD